MTVRAVPIGNGPCLIFRQYWKEFKGHDSSAHTKAHKHHASYTPIYCAHIPPYPAI